MIDSGGKCRRGFTLIELLVVVGIMAVVVTLTIPSFSGLGRGAKMNSALNGLKTTMSLARQWAISHRDMVYVVLITAGSTSTGSSVHPGRSYAVISENDENFLKEIASLPEGIVFEINKTVAELEADPPEWISDLFADSNLGSPEFAYIAFEQDGSLTKANYPRIYLTEGTVDESGQIKETFTRSDDKFDTVRVNGFTGIGYVERDYSD